MKMRLSLYLILGLALCLSTTSCRKFVSTAADQPPPQTTPGDTTRPVIKPDTTTPPIIPYPQAPATGCFYSPNYGDSIIYPQPTNGQDYIVSPLNAPSPGKFLSWPIGLSIDSTTGAIDVTKSETGMRYAIGFVKNGTTDTCITPLIIGGASYFDGIYILSDGVTTALPYFEANAFLQSPCAGNGCTFDITGSAANQKIIMNDATGVIDLEKTLNGTGLLGGAFGLIPLNGQTVTSTIYYRLNDPSNSALQHIDVQFVYYYSKSQIGTGLLTGILTKLTNILSGNMVSTVSNPRPPLIVIVRRP